MKIERIVLGVLLVLLIWFGAAIARLENYHYAAQLGFCEEYKLPDRGEKDNCLNKTRTRTSWILNLFYGLQS